MNSLKTRRTTIATCVIVFSWLAMAYSQPKTIEQYITDLESRHFSFPPEPQTVDAPRSDAAEQLVKLGSAAVDPLIPFLNDKRGYVRRRVALILGRIGDLRALKPLIITALTEPTGDTDLIQKEMFDIISRFDASITVRILLRHLEESITDSAPPKTNFDYHDVIKALVRLNDNLSVRPLIEILEDKSVDWPIRSWIAWALGEMKNPEAIEALTNTFSEEGVGGLPEGSAKALVRIDHPEAVDPLVRLLKKEDPEVSSLAARTLGELNDKRAIQPLIEYLENCKSLAAVEALSALKASEAVPALISVLQVEDDQVRSAAAAALGDLGDEGAIDPLVCSLAFWQSNSESAKALVKLGWLPQSDTDRVHFWVAERNGVKLNENLALVEKVLLKDLVSDAYPSIENALCAFISLGKEDMTSKLVSVLHSNGNVPMATTYLNCGNEDLEKAAEEWAYKHGYLTGACDSLGGAASVSWGSIQER